MKKKHILIMFSAAAGLSGAAAVDSWPERAATIQMLLYSAIVAGVLFSSFWSDRRHPKYLTGMLVIFLLHCVCFFSIRSYFPFTTIISIVPVVFLEVVVLMAVMIKVRGSREVEQDRINMQFHSKTTTGQIKPAKRRN